MKPPYYGSLGDEMNESDYQLGSDIEIARAKNKFTDHNITYDQDEVSSVSCTIHGAMTALSSLTGYRFSLDERKELWQKAVEKGANPNVGWWTNKAVDLVREYWNGKNPDNRVYSFRSSMLSQKSRMMLRLGYTAVVSHRGNSKFNSDKNDGVLDKIIFGDTTYGHVLSRAYSPGETFDKIINNYPSTHKFNIYKVPTKNFPSLVQNRVFFAPAYFYVLDYKDSNPIVPIWAKESYEKAISKGIITNSDNLNTIVMDAKQEDILFKLGALSQKSGGVNLIRWIVALDRLKII